MEFLSSRSLGLHSIQANIPATDLLPALDSLESLQGSYDSVVYRLHVFAELFDPARDQKDQKYCAGVIDALHDALLEHGGAIERLTGELRAVLAEAIRMPQSLSRS